MPKLDRIAQLRGILEERRLPIPLKTLANRMECSESTVRRLLDSLRDGFGAPVEYDRKGGGWRLDLRNGERNLTLPGLWFRADELQAMISFNELLRQVQPGLLASTLAPLSERIGELLAARGLTASEVSRQVRILPIGARAVPPQSFIAVTQALLQRYRLTFEYLARGREREEPPTRLPPRQVSPQRLVWYRSNWYLGAWCHQSDQLRIFALERIVSPRIDPEPAQDCADELLDHHFDDAYGIFGGAATETAVLRFNAWRARWIADELWHRRQEGRCLPDGGYELRIPYGEPHELIMDILRYGAEVEVLAPDSLRLAVRQKLQELLNVYR